MKIAFGLLAAAVLCTTPLAAGSATGMAAMQFYVGSWKCTGGAPGEAPTTASLTNTLDDGVLHESIAVPPQGKMKSPYMLSISTTYDAKHARYVQTGLDNQAAWWVGYAKPWTGSTEKWIDHANSSGKPGRTEFVRTGVNGYTITGYATIAAAKSNFKVTCSRST
jgi:hypothetical protein